MRVMKMKHEQPNRKTVSVYYACAAVDILVFAAASFRQGPGQSMVVRMVFALAHFVAVHGSRFTVHGFQDILSAFLASFRPSRHASISSKRSIFIVTFFFSTVNRER
jgi:hypothetical protein